MNVRYATRQLERCYAEQARAVRRWGQQVGRRYKERVDALYSLPDWPAAFRIRAWDAHPLRGDRAGQFAIRLTGRWRLIVMVESETNTVTLEEVSDHYGD